MPLRQFTSGSSYRYGFNGQEQSKELSGDGNSYTAEFWQYDSRLGRRWNPDPVYQHSPYTVLGNNPISFVDPDGADTISIQRTTTIRHLKGFNDGHSDNLVTPSRVHITQSGKIVINEAKGNDVYRITNTIISIDENGNQTTSSNTTTLDLNNPQTFYRTGGHNMKGFIDDRYALAAYAPAWLLNSYAAKSGDIGVKSAIAYQKDMRALPYITATAAVAEIVFTGGISGFLSASSKGVAYTNVGRWMSQAELKAMNTTGMIQQGAGGQTFVTTGGATSYMGAARGSVYVEFQVPTKSLLQGGKDGWFKLIGPNASKTMQYQLNKQGGPMLPQFKNLTGYLKQNRDAKHSVV